MRSISRSSDSTALLRHVVFHLPGIHDMVKCSVTVLKHRSHPVSVKSIPVFRLADQNRYNLYSISYQNGSKTILFGARHSNGGRVRGYGLGKHLCRKEHDLKKQLSFIELVNRGEFYSETVNPEL